jgi:magnesium-transporting ATPase (P-type)
VLQVLALDIGTDLLPALALGAEPPTSSALDTPPVRGHLIDRSILRRAFGRLGPTEAIVEIGAFVAVLVASGWRPGDPAPTGSVLLTASGAAFSAVVLGQLATALACRSSTRWVGQTGVRGNPLLAGAIGVELLLLVGFLAFAPVADLLGHQVPSALGLAVAATAIPAVILVDLIDKLRHPH